MALKSLVSILFQPMNLISFSPKLRYLGFQTQCYTFTSSAVLSNRKCINKTNISPQTGKSNTYC